MTLQSVGWRDGDLFLEVRVQPRASREQITGIVNARFKISICAAPVDNAANRNLQQFLAREFGVAKSRVQVIRGLNSRNKRVLIQQPGRRPKWLTPLGN